MKPQILGKNGGSKVVHLIHKIIIPKDNNILFAEMKCLSFLCLNIDFQKTRFIIGVEKNRHIIIKEKEND